MSQSEAMEIRGLDAVRKIKGSEKRDSSPSEVDDDEEDQFEEHENITDLKNFDEIYGSTPPRTRIKNKNKSWVGKQQKMDNQCVKMRPGKGRLVRSRADRRNTLDCAILNQMIIEPSIDDKTRSDKRTLQMQRDYERDQKLSAVNNVHARVVPQRSSLSLSTVNNDDSFEQLDLAQTEPKCIESSNRFMSVKSRPVGCRISAPPSSFIAMTFPKISTSTESAPQTRKEFHETFSNLIKLGSNDKQERSTRVPVISKEEQLWQTEVKDMIWLELQANMADRTLEQQDRFLFAARQSIAELLREIMGYRFNRKYFRNDSGISSGLSTAAVTASNSANENARVQQNGFCFGCLSMYCKDCLDSQTIALRQVESLLTRLEAAEDLFPSNKSMGGYFPIYQSFEFINRIKALNQWYNITRHHRLKLMILGKVLAKLQGKEYKWPLVEAESGSSGSSVQETENDSARASSAECSNKSNEKQQQQRVQFNNVDETDHNSSDSANSDDSFKSSYNLQPIGEYGILLDSLYSWKLDTTDSTPNSTSASPYRKFIENVLKSRGLGKSLSFLHQLHNNVLRKAHVTLEKPGTEDIEHELFDDEVSNIEIPLEKDEVEELRRYGIWCEEFKELSLPPYISAFLFLSKIPLEVVHEFMKMKLETKPVNPNPLSLEQLIKELKEGLTLALIHRDRYNKHIATALVDREHEADPFLQIIDDFDRTLKQIFELYMEYVEQWILVGVPTSHRKTALEDEWKFTKLTCPMIIGEHKIAANRFCDIIQKLFDAIGQNLIEKVTEMENFSFEVPTTFEIKEKPMQNEENGEIDDEEEEEDPSTILKNRLLTMCRETQQLFTDERDKCVKLMTFTKTLFKDIEKEDFHRDHNVVDESQVCLRHSTCMCTEVLETINALKRKMLLLREKLTSTLLKVQERSETRYMSEMEEADRITVLTRCREILHVGYKFGFEYHKNLSALFESTTVTNSRSSQTNSSLAKAIVGFARCWMNFVMGRCERGRGLRPRWAAQGLDFLIIACDPHNTEQIDETEFEELKSSMDKCISHVIGSIHEPDRVRKSPRSRKSSPAPTRKRTPTRSSISYTPTAQKVILQQLSVQSDSSRVRLTPSPDPRDYPTDYLIRKQISYENVNDISIKVPDSPNSLYSPELRHVRIRDAVNHLDLTLENKLRSKNLIGSVKELNSCDKVVIRARSVHFSWHRGIKIGQGRFGKVYTAVNNSTGDLMAMKEIPIQAGETVTIRRVAEELKIFEGINHRHLVKYYGVEIHREELLIFMELCSEGSLESLCEISGGLHEALVRRFTTQLLLAVEELHKHGVVHRDIKCANIFLTNGGNCLKLGDFGSAVKIKFHTTMQGELKGYVGTQAYMAPEVFTKTNTEGHGRAADIWSVGCCVIEMASGKRPWYQYDSNFQIMFKVGMGETPEIPSTLSHEGVDFVECCLVHDPKDRWTASELLQHHIFCKVVIGDDCDECDKKETLVNSKEE